MKKTISLLLVLSLIFVSCLVGCRASVDADDNGVSGSIQDDMDNGTIEDGNSSDGAINDNGDKDGIKNDLKTDDTQSGSKNDLDSNTAQNGSTNKNDTDKVTPKSSYTGKSGKI